MLISILSEVVIVDAEEDDEIDDEVTVGVPGIFVSYTSPRLHIKCILFEEKTQANRH
jgi:hypothetical protein